MDHFGYFEVSLATVPVSPGQPQSLFNVPLHYEVELQNGTAYHNFPIVIPANVTCNPTCTVQVRQWADDFDWYYYACVDVDVLNRSTFEAMSVLDPEMQDTESNCTSRIAAGRCGRWEPGPFHIRTTILQTIVFGSVALVCLIGLVVVIIVRCVKYRRLQADGAAGKKLDAQRDQETLSESATTATSPPSMVRMVIVPAIVAVVVSTVALLITGIVFICLKTCNYATEGEVSL